MASTICENWQFSKQASGSFPKLHTHPVSAISEQNLAPRTQHNSQHVTHTFALHAWNLSFRQQLKDTVLRETAYRQQVALCEIHW